MWIFRLSLPFVALLLLRFCSAAFVETYKLDGFSTSNYLLDTFIVDVALDVDNQLLKFYINSKVDDMSNSSTTEPIITDVDLLTNRYTTFHVDIDFMGKTFIKKDLRFCDILAVKNTSDYEDSPRYAGSLSPLSSAESPTSTALPKLPWAGFNDSSIARRQYPNGYLHFNESNSDFGLFASNNNTIEKIFSNSTGDLIGCPLYQNDSIAMYYQADISDHFNRLGSYTVKFAVVSNGQQSNVIGGVRVYVTPVLQPPVLSSTLFFGVFSLLLVTNCINFLITVFSPYQETSNPFLIEASTICNERLLKQLEASINRIVGYFQFALFLSALDLQYPGFLQPLMGQIRWCALLGINLLKKKTSIPLLESENIYITLNSSGLGALDLYSSSSFVYYSWPNFMLCLLCWIAIAMVVYQILIMFRLFTSNFKRSHPKFMRSLPTVFGMGENNEVVFKYALSKNAWALFGHFLRQLLSTFGMPFLVLTFFMLYTSNNLSDKYWRLSQDHLRIDAFNETMSYDDLVCRPKFTNGTSFITSQRRNLHSIPLGSIIGGYIALVIWFALIAYFIFRYLLTFKRWVPIVNPNLRKLYTSIKVVIVWSYFYNEYRPDKAHFAVVDLLYTVLVLIIVGLLQKLGTVQVVLLIVLEFVQLSILVTVRPYYLKMRWYSLSWIIPAARLIQSILCIPYIRPLNVAEAPRTYIAYVQMLIHLFVAFTFVIHLFYCLGLTGTSFMRETKEKKNLGNYLGAKGASVDDFNDGFEYQPVAIKKETSSPRAEGETLSPRTTGAEEGGEVDYYRTKSEKILQRSQHLHAPTGLHHENSWEDEVTSDELDFEHTEARKQQKDYTTREGDRLYHKFFLDGAVDPEIRDLWLSREWNVETPTSPLPLAPEKLHEKTLPARFAGLAKHFSLLRACKKATKTKGFEVSRPRQIVVKPMHTVADTLNLSDHQSD